MTVHDVRGGRLQHAGEIDEPSGASLRRILAAASPGPAMLGTLLAGSGPGDPEPGQLWRVGRREALLVWVRRVLDGAVDVLPVVMDVELADRESVLLPGTATPLGTELALLTDVHGRLDPRAFLQFVADLDVAGQVEQTWAAAREGRAPEGVAVGPPIDAEDDQRVEYRQVLADLLADMRPGRWDEDEAEAPLTTNVQQDVVDVIADELRERHRGSRVSAVEPHRVTVDAEHDLNSLARVGYLDTSVIVAALDGPKAWRLFDTTALAEACLQVVRSEPDADAVAVTVSGADWLTVVLQVPDMRRAYEPPGGPQKGPRLVMEPLPIVDALLKHLDRHVTSWEATEPVRAPIGGTDVAAVAARNAASAIARLSLEGKRATTPAKKAAWTTLPVVLSERIAEVIVAISRNESLDDALRHLTREEGA